MRDKILVPKRIYLGVHEFHIEFNKLLIDAQSFGRTSHSSECIQLNPTNTEAQNNVSFWHEFMHAISAQQLGANLQEAEICCLSEGVANILKQLGITLDFSNLAEGGR
jgi:hypothetical protein